MTRTTPTPHQPCNYFKLLDWNPYGGKPPKFEHLLHHHEQKGVISEKRYDPRFFWHRSCHGNVMTSSRLLRAPVLGTREHKGTCTSHGCPDFGKVWRNSMRKFWKYSILKRICKGHKNIEYTCYEGRAVRVFRLPTFTTPLVIDSHAHKPI